MFAQTQNLVFNKRGVSGVISAVMLILITIVAIVALAGFVIPFVKQLQDNSDFSCMEIIGEVELDLSKSCYDSLNHEVKLRIKFGNVELDEIYVSLEDKSGGLKRVDLVNGEQISEVNSGVAIILPGKGGRRTYVFDYGEEYVGASVGAIINGEECPQSNKIKLRKC